VTPDRKNNTRHYLRMTALTFVFVSKSCAKSFSGDESPVIMPFESRLFAVQHTTHARWNTAHGTGNGNCVFCYFDYVIPSGSINPVSAVEMSNLGQYSKALRGTDSFQGTVGRATQP
jgi:hypothetical protein